MRRWGCERRIQPGGPERAASPGPSDPGPSSRGAGEDGGPSGSTGSSGGSAAGAVSPSPGLADLRLGARRGSLTDAHVDQRPGLLADAGSSTSGLVQDGAGPAVEPLSEPLSFSDLVPGLREVPRCRLAPYVDEPGRSEAGDETSRAGARSARAGEGGAYDAGELLSRSEFLAVTALLDMGFGRDATLVALIEAKWDVQIAASSLAAGYAGPAAPPPSPPTSGGPPVELGYMVLRCPDAIAHLRGRHRCSWHPLLARLGLTSATWAQSKAGYYIRRYQNEQVALDQWAAQRLQAPFPIDPGLA